MTYLVEAHMPAGTDAAEVAARARKAAQGLSGEDTAVRYVRSVFVPADETCFHFFEAVSEAAVREASKRGGLSAHRVVEALPELDPDHADGTAKGEVDDDSQ
jgi:hypothetical protein